MTEIREDSQAFLDLRLQVFDSPDSRLAAVAQDIGFEAWYDALKGKRARRVVANAFGISRRGKELYHRELYLAMEAAADIGRFSGVIASVGERAVGYAWAMEDARPTRAQRLADFWRGNLPAVSIKAFNVLPSEQEQGIGSHMLHELMTPYVQQYPLRRSPQRVEIDVPAELSGAVLWLNHRGFSAAVETPEPDHRFGDADKPVEVRKMVAPTAGKVHRRTLDRISDSHFDAPAYLVVDALGNEVEQI